MNKQLPYFVGHVFIKTYLEIEQLGKILSKVIFNNVPFEGRDLDIYDEVPAIFIKGELLGLKIVLSGYPESIKTGAYDLAIRPQYYNKDFEYNKFPLDTYLTELLKEYLRDYPEIKILEIDKETI